MRSWFQWLSLGLLFEIVRKTVSSFEVYDPRERRHPLFALKFSDNVLHSKADAEALVASAPQSNELIPIEMNIHLIEVMLFGCGAKSDTQTMFMRS